MKIIKLKSENVKRLKAIEIDPKSNFMVIGGKNGEGKTSAIDSISLALGGGNELPAVPIRKGEKKGGVLLELDGEEGTLIVSKTLTEKGAYLKVTSADDKISSPQKLLDSLVGKLTFDPLAFITMESEKRVATMREVLGVDLSDLVKKHQETYEERRLVNREVQRLKQHYDSLPEFPRAAGERVDVSKVLAEQKHYIGLVESYNEKRRDINSLTVALENIEEENRDLEDKLEEIRETIETNKAKLIEGHKELETLKAALNGEDEAVAKLEAAEKTIENAEKVNTEITANETAERAKKEYLEKKVESEKLTGYLEQYNAEKIERLANAKEVVKGLEMTDDSVLLNGVPFEQASQAEQLKASVEMGIAANPTIKILLIRNGSLLDDDNLALLAEIAAERDYQIWLERVGDGDECSVIIEDGRILEDRQK